MYRAVSVIVDSTDSVSSRLPAVISEVFKFKQTDGLDCFIPRSHEFSPIDTVVGTSLSLSLFVGL